MSTELAMIGRTLDAVLRQAAMLPDGGYAGVPPLDLLARALALGLRTIRSDLAMAEFAAAAETRRRGARWIVRPRQRTSMATYEALRLKAVQVLELLLGSRAEPASLGPLLTSARAEAGADLRPDLERAVATGRLTRAGLRALPLAVVLVLVIHVMRHGAAPENGSRAA